MGVFILSAKHRRNQLRNHPGIAITGLRPHYHPDYYGAYFRDPDGNKLCVCCHEPDPNSSTQAAR